MSIPKFYTLSIKNIVPETTDCISVSFDIPENLQEAFAFCAGQYVTLKKIINGVELRRSYSICSAPNENELRVAIKKIDNGMFSKYANDNFKVGDSIEVMNPIGTFTIKENKNANKIYFAFASGSGITPIMSIVKNILHQDADSKFTLVYGNKNVESIIFKNELDKLEKQFSNRFHVVHIFSREKQENDWYNGRITKEKCEQLFESLLSCKNMTECFLCGPEEMVQSVKTFFTNKGVDAGKIKFELFNTSVKEKENKLPSANGGKISKVILNFDNEVVEMDLPQDGETILDVALKLGADLPFACKGGVCCTCKAKILEGTATMDENYSLDPDEVEAGYILTCQAHPTSDRLVVEF